jgi:L-rhamnose mutarotase
MKTYCFALDLRDDENLINEYDAWHRAVWPEVLASIRDAGIEELDIPGLQSFVYDHENG